MEKEAKASALKSIKPPESKLSSRLNKRRKLNLSMRGNTLEEESFLSMSAIRESGEKSVEIKI